MGRLKHSDLIESDRSHRPATLGELAAQSLDVFCWCNRCGHNAVLATDNLMDQLGAAVPVPEIGTWLRCSECRGKDIATRPNWRGLGTVTRHGPIEAASSSATGGDGTEGEESTLNEHTSDMDASPLAGDGDKNI